MSPSTQPPPPRLERELIPPDSPLHPFISVNPGVMHGEPCFRGTRVPVQVLFDHLTGGDTLDAFCADYPNVKHETAVAVIDLASRGLVEGLRRL